MKHFSYRNYVDNPLAAALNSHYEHNAPLPHLALLYLFTFNQNAGILPRTPRCVPSARSLELVAH